ncbi:MAG: 3-oxoacyl-[acyl-carrier-protein] reductase [Bacteroidales bacterium]|nr:3-oxoacyl-[acyl-carrier-protein] reductase [Bacteroidales bacterium]
MMLLENKITLVTGASRGIGKRTAQLFAENGATVIFTDLQENDASRELLAELQQHSPKSCFIASNAADYEQTMAVAEQVQKEYGRLDALVNNAGITRDNLLLRMSPQDWDLVLEVNLRSVFNYCKAFVPMMLKQRSGSIINTASVVGVNGNAGQCNYSASKAGIIGFSKSLAKEIGSRGIRCNAIAPGLIESAMTQAMPKEAHDKWLNEIPLRRGGTDLDIARTSMFLASDLSEYITGQVICVDGGVSL